MTVFNSFPLIVNLSKKPRFQRNAVKVLLFVLTALMLNSCAEHETVIKQGKPPTEHNEANDDPQPGEWLNHPERLDTADACMRRLLDLIQYLDTETISRRYTFDKFEIPDHPIKTLAALDIKSSRTARAFRTNIGYELREKGINFAGKYSFVGVGMTGWGENRWIVDRTNGRAFEFPYRVNEIEFRKNSNLIIIRPRAKFLSELQQSVDPRDLCDERMAYDPEIDLRPAYLLWRNDSLLFLAGGDQQLPTTEEFWKSFFGSGY